MSRCTATRELAGKVFVCVLEEHPALPTEKPSWEWTGPLRADKHYFVARERFEREDGPWPK